ncbi:MAG: metallophosphoesterase [Syntrophobacteraceae bacterium]
MRRPRYLPLCALALFLACGLVFAPHLLGAPGGQFLCVSDIHFDPLVGLSASVGKQIVNSGYKSWHGIYAKHPQPASGYGSETNFTLLDSALQEMRSACPHPDFIVFSGDLLAHAIHKMYAYVGNDRHKLIRQTLSFISYQFDHYFPGVPIFFTLGNNDHYHDYGFAPNDPFFRETGADFFRFYLKGDGVSRASFDKSFFAAGNYSARPAASPKNKIIALNNNFFSISSQNQHKEESLKQLDRLESELASARAKRERVWIVMHIPPGVDVQGALKKKQALSFWARLENSEHLSLLDKFIRLLVEYSPETAAIFSGHTHMDYFRLILNRGVASTLVHGAPAVTPQFGNNPGFQVFRYDKESFDLIDYDTYRYGYIHGWAKEYNLKQAYGTSLYDPAGMDTVWDRIQSDKAVRKHYTDFYTVGSTKVSIAEVWKAYWCGIANLGGDGFNTCYAAQTIFQENAGTDWDRAANF